MPKYKVGVCESAPELIAGSPAWDGMCGRVQREKPDLFLLNELPFGSWAAAAPVFSETGWRRTCELHEQGVARLGDIGAPLIASSRACEVDGERVNQAFIWSSADGAEPAHTKQFFPEEEGYWEARWFTGGERHFRVVDAGALRVGFLLCTEVMFNEWARHYGRNGAAVLLVPRAVGKASLHRWLVAMRMAAIVSGCYVLSSNRAGTDSKGQEFGGQGWVVDPEGNVVAQTSASTPIAYHEIDTDAVAKAQSGYPCYVRE